jgi:ribosome maturation factor RimP
VKLITVDQITPVVESKLKELGLELFSIRFFSAGSRGILRITVDKEGGVTIGECELASNEIAVLLDIEEFAKDRPYNLEVSSPGIDRPLHEERDFRRITGRTVMVNLKEGVEGKKVIRGDVVKCENGILTLNIENRTVEIPLTDIFSGREELRFK